MPEVGGAQIIFESGSVTGKKAVLIRDLRAIDPCAKEFDGDAVTVQLPPNAGGYKVYARALAKPTDNPWMTVTPSLVSAEDEFENPLIYIGKFDSNGFETAEGRLVRYKGKSRAIDATGLFQFTGDVCYSVPQEADDPGALKCCIDSDLDGLYDSCIDPVDGRCSAGNLVTLYSCTPYTGAWIFDIADFAQYMWTLDNNGSKLVQLRFYPVQ